MQVVGLLHFLGGSLCVKTIETRRVRPITYNIIYYVVHHILCGVLCGIFVISIKSLYNAYKPRTYICVVIGARKKDSSCFAFCVTFSVKAT